MTTYQRDTVNLVGDLMAAYFHFGEHTNAERREMYTTAVYLLGRAGIKADHLTYLGIMQLMDAMRSADMPVARAA